MINTCKKAIKKQDLSIILNECNRGRGSSIWEYIPHEPYYANGYVYFLMQGQKVVYIGASGNRQRIGAHKKDKVFDGFYYFMCKNFEHWKIETLLIDSFQTLYNKQGASCCNRKERVKKHKPTPLNRVNFELQ